MQQIIAIFDPHRLIVIMIGRIRGTILQALTVLLWMGVANLYGQEQTGEMKQRNESALTSFERGDYNTALAGFRTLLKSEGNNVIYKYYTGRCLVELNEGLDEAIELLYGCSRTNGPLDALFYLGKAYMRSYNFHEAISYFEKYEMNASRQERKLLGVRELIETCRSAEEITSVYNPFEVMNVTFMDLSDSLQFSQVKMKGGDLTFKPDAYFQMDEDRTALSCLMFRPKETIRGDYLYYSGYGKNGKDGAQIFRIRKGPGIYWSDPEEVSSLNSPGNEILPYFDPIEKDIYFASDGRLGVGGYDLYKSHYDSDRDKWTDPINLGFPVNSVMDEYLLLPGSDLGMVLFFTNRYRTDSTVAVYRLHLIEPKKKTANGDPVKLRTIAQLGGVTDEIFAGPVAEQKTPPKKVQMNGSSSGKPDEINVSTYQRTLSEALSHQVTSDSLKDLAAGARIKVRESDDPNDRWVWQQQIMVWEKKARDEEAMADQLYAKMEKERSENSTGPSVNPPEAIEVDRIIDDLTVYRYKPPGTGTKDAFVAPTSVVDKVPVLSSADRFDILSHSAYNEGNPIPMDIVLPSGTYYRIQLGAYGNLVDPEIFVGITPVTGEHVKELGLVKYYAGKFTKYDEASTALPRIHTLGFEDAFIVAWYNGNPVPANKAKQLE